MRPDQIVKIFGTTAPTIITALEKFGIVKIPKSWKKIFDISPVLESFSKPPSGSNGSGSSTTQIPTSGMTGTGNAGTQPGGQPFSGSPFPGQTGPPHTGLPFPAPSPIGPPIHETGFGPSSGFQLGNQQYQPGVPQHGSSYGIPSTQQLQGIQQQQPGPSRPPGGSAQAAYVHGVLPIPGYSKPPPPRPYQEYGAYASQQAPHSPQGGAGYYDQPGFQGAPVQTSNAFPSNIAYPSMNSNRPTYIQEPAWRP